MAIGTAMADPCDVTSGEAFVRHDLTADPITSNSYCELCDTGYITIIIANPYDEDTDMTNMTVVEDLGSSGLTYNSDPTLADRMQVNGVNRPGAAPIPGPPNGSVLTWTSTQVTELARLAANSNPSAASTLTLRFAVIRVGTPPLTHEGLVGANRNIQASMTFTAEDVSGAPTVQCPGMPATASDSDELPLREPIPTVTKLGRNVDAGQDSDEYSQQIYGNNDDDIIWRIAVGNGAGTADLQDLRLDDILDVGSLNITDLRFICGSEGDASTVAAANGVDSGGLCRAFPGTWGGDEIRNYDVDLPFSSPTVVDATAGGIGYLYLVGKIPDSPNGSCSSDRTNTVSDVQWGCDAETPAGGITTTSSGASPGSATATLNTLSDRDLDIGVAYIGFDVPAMANPNAGTKGRVVITITNNSGGTVSDLVVTNTLPSEYRMDPTADLELVATGAYGGYPGQADDIAWSNPDTLLNNTAPVFTLTSPDATNDGHNHLLRNGDAVEITFGIILVNSPSYDRTADIDIDEEDPSASSTDPDHSILANLANSVSVDFNDFCTGGSNNDTYPSTHTPQPEDLDIRTGGISGPVLDYILTNDGTATLSVFLENNGGHPADDYYVYVAFGETMEVDSAPGGCQSPPVKSPAFVEWQTPLGYPGTATVYECTGSPVPIGGSRTLDFVVSKTLVPSRVDADDLTFRADVVGEITLADGNPLDEPAPLQRGDLVTDPYNNYTVDGFRGRVMGFNLTKEQNGDCTENNPPSGSPDDEVQIGEECTYNIRAGGWFGFRTPGYEPIEVRNVQLDDDLPNGQGYVDRFNQVITSQIDGINFLRSVAPSPPVQYDMREGTVYWTFNQSNYITQRDEWFESDIQTRVLNDPVDSSNPPNEHTADSINTATAEFDVFFLVDTADEFDIRYGPSMTVYPPESGRQVTLTVTEPYITVEKEVCNESLSGTGIGPSCTPFLPEVTNGDAYNNYVYRLRVSNQASSGGVTRAPAYDVTVTDTLDSSDLAYVIPFEGDGLDNDGDGGDEIPAGDEGAISENSANGGTPAVLTFSYTHSNALERIDPGGAVVLYYRVDFEDVAAPEQRFTNTAYATYDSLAGPYGNQSDPPPSDRDYDTNFALGIGDARDYTSSSDSATVEIIPVATDPKSILDLSSTPIAGSGTQGVSIGEEIEYQLNAFLPVAQLQNFIIEDQLPTGLTCVEAPDVNLDALPYSNAGFDPGGTFAPTCSGNLVRWNFGTQRLTQGTAGLNNRFDFEISFIARVDNIAGNNDGDLLENGGGATNTFVQYVDEVGATITRNFGQVDVRVREPRIDLDKSFSAPNPDAADVLTVTVTAENDGTATAYNLRVMDDLRGTHMTYVGNVGGANAPNSIDTSVGNRPIFSWSDPNGIDVGNTVSFTFEVRVDGVVEPQEILDNTIQADWTSLQSQTTALINGGAGPIGANGAADGMRIGALPNSNPPDTLNDYEAEAFDSVVVPEVTLAKTDQNPTAIPAIGQHKSFQIVITLPEGDTDDLLVTDALDSTGLSYVLENDASFNISYTFVGIDNINGGPVDESSFNAFPADETSGNAVWNIGNVETLIENDTVVNAISPSITINYLARINNDAVTDAGDTLQNDVLLNYTHGEDNSTVALNDDTDAVTVVEPSLTLGKTVAKATNIGNPLQAGDILRYTLTFTAAGGANTSDAWDLRIDDSMSLGLVYSGNPTVTGGGNSIGAPDITGDGVTTPQTLRWSLEDGNADIAITAGTTVTVTYEVEVDASVLVNQILSNSATAQWTSLDGINTLERNGTGAPWNSPVGAAYNDYFTGPATTSLVVGDNNTTSKSRITDTYVAGDDVVRIGDIVEYELSLGIQEGTLLDASAVDTLPQGLIFEEIVSINGDDTAPYQNQGPFVHGDITAADIVPAGDPTIGPHTLTISIGDITNTPDGNTANDFFIIRYRARVMNLVHAQLDSITLTNSLAMSYTTATVPVTTIPVTESIEVRQPNLTVAKSSAPPDGSVVAASQTITYTVDITNNGTAPAYDTVLRDILPEGMRNGSVTTLNIQIPPGNDLATFAPSYDSATGVATWDFDSGTADQYNIPPGGTLRLIYETDTDAGLGPGMTLTNSAQVQLYYSFDDDAVPTEGGAVGIREIYGPSNFDSVTFTTAGAVALDKANSVSSAAIGQPFTYRITIPESLQDTALHDVRILDDLSASGVSLTFVSVTRVSGLDTWDPENTGTATNLVIEDPTGGIEIPANSQAIIDITVRLVDTQPTVDPPQPPNDTGNTFANTATYTFNQVDDDDGFQQSGGGDTTADMTIVGPDMLVMDKTGPASMSVGTPGAFTLDIHNTWTGDAYNLTVVDRLPDDATNGGTCDAGPSNITVQYFDDVGAPTSVVLTEGTHYTITFTGAPTCEWTLQMLSAAGPLRVNEHLVVNYETNLDLDTINAVSMTNVAGVTQWYGYDPNDADADPHQYTEDLTDGTPGDDTDQEDAHIIDAYAPDLEFEKRVRNVTTGQNPGLNASPGDTLHYTLEITNNGLSGLTDFTIEDEVDGLNDPARFVAGSLVLTNVPGGADTSGTDPMGGTNGTGLVNITNLDIGAAGSGNNTLVVEFEVTLRPVIPSGTIVYNQAGLTSIIPTTILSDDPNIGGGTDPTETLIASAPQFRVQKISTDLTDDPDVLMAGDTLRYTITIKNIGDEDANNVRLQDSTPANTAYVANSTTLNGTAVADGAGGVNPLHAGILINAPENTTPGYMRADADAAANNVATVTFDVVVDPSAMDGLVIENQGFVSSEGEGSGARPDQPSDDPDTPIPDDPTRDVVGNVPLLYAHKTVVISQDFGTAGIVDPGDVLRYTIDIRNSGAIPATDVVLTDNLPTNTTYLLNSTELNGVAQSDVAGVSPLVGGLTLQSSDNPGAGIISVDESAVVTFEATVNLGLPTGTIISNQGSITSNELSPGLTDADGLPSNGYQPTIVVVGDAQLLAITKEVSVVGGGAALAGGELAYTIRVTNLGSLPATNVVVTDDLGPPLDTLVTYVAGSGTLDGATAGVSYAGNILTADYASTYGGLPAGTSTVVRFRVQINASVAIGTTITNTAEVRWNSPAQTDSASVSIDVGGTPGSGTLNGNVWHDANLDQVYDSGEVQLAGWTAALYYSGTVVTTTTTDSSGVYQFSGLTPNDASPERFEIRFTALGAGADAAALGYADSIFTDGPHRISDIIVASGGNLQNLNLPIQPNGTVYNSVVREAISGVTLTMQNAASGAAVSEQCFDDPNQQGQVTADEGYYKFDMNFRHSSCPAGGTYLIDVTEPSSGFLSAPSVIIPPESDASTAAFSVPACPGSPDDAVPATAGYCESVADAAIPPLTVLPRTDGTTYQLHLLLSDGSVPGESQIYNNPIPIDPELDGATAITKTSSKVNVTRGSLVPYTITVTNVFGVPLYDLSIIDRFPAGFKYVANSARMDGTASEPTRNGRELTWSGLTLQANEKITLKFILVVGSGVSENEYTNIAFVYDTVVGTDVSGEASATVRVVADPDFDCSDVIGKVFDDANRNGRQDKGEEGLKGVRVVSAQGLIATTDKHGRFHITCAIVPDEDRGTNFILKVDERSLPTGYRLTTENPRVQRATRGKMLRYNFGATIHRVVRMDIADGVFEPDTTDLRMQWAPKIDQLIEELKKKPSVLRLTYLGDLESKGLVSRRLRTLKKAIAKEWKKSDGGYVLTIETEIFWRRGAPVKKR